MIFYDSFNAVTVDISAVLFLKNTLFRMPLVPLTNVIFSKNSLVLQDIGNY